MVPLPKSRVIFVRESSDSDELRELRKEFEEKNSRISAQQEKMKERIVEEKRNINRGFVGLNGGKGGQILVDRVKPYIPETSLLPKKPILVEPTLTKEEKKEASKVKKKEKKEARKVNKKEKKDPDPKGYESDTSDRRYDQEYETTDCEVSLSVFRYTFRYIFMYFLDALFRYNL